MNRYYLDWLDERIAKMANKAKKNYQNSYSRGYALGYMDALLSMKQHHLARKKNKNAL